MASPTVYACGRSKPSCHGGGVAFGGIKKGGIHWIPPCNKCVRWCATLPHPAGCSTIAVPGLSFRVRNGCRASPLGHDHRKNQNNHAMTAWWWRFGNRLADACRFDPPPGGLTGLRGGGCVGSVGPLVPVGFTPLRGVHVRSINPVVFGGPSHREGGGELVLKRASRLDAFSGYPSRT